MTIEDIKRLIAKDETRTLELKKTTGELKDGMHSACAMLNTDGGWLIFGIAPKSLRILGQVVTDKTRQEIANALTGLEPTVDIPVEYIDVPEAKEGEQVIAIHFGGWIWGMHPYTYHGRSYYKSESVTKVMPQEMYDDRVRESRPMIFAWERQESVGVTVNDLSEKFIRNCARRGVEGGRQPESSLDESTEELLNKWNLLSPDNKPNNAAVALFVNDTKSYTQLSLRMARFRGNDKNVFIDNQRTEGNLFDLLDAGMSFFFKHLNLGGVINGLQREEQLEIPVIALRESLTNALCHRSYLDLGTTVSIAIYDDRVEITNPGHLPSEITPDNIKQSHNSHPYNPLIANALYRSGYLENWGSGVKRILDACKENGVTEPQWVSDGKFVNVVFFRPLSKEKDDKSNHSASEGLSWDQVGTKLGLSRDQVKSMFLMLKEPTLAKDIRESLGFKNSTKFKKKYIDSLISEEIVAMTQPDKPTSATQKYYLTEKGLAILKVMLCHQQ